MNVHLFNKSLKIVELSYMAKVTIIMVQYVMSGMMIDVTGVDNGQSFPLACSSIFLIFYSYYSSTDTAANYTILVLLVIFLQDS